MENMEKRSFLLYRALPAESPLAEFLDAVFLALLLAAVVAAAASSPWSAAAAAGAALALYGAYDIRRRSLERAVADVRDVITGDYELTAARCNALESAGLPKDIVVILEKIHGVYKGTALIEVLEARIPRKRLKEHLPLVLSYAEGIAEEKASVPVESHRDDSTSLEPSDAPPAPATPPMPSAPTPTA